MAVINVANRRIDVNVEEELRRYKWQRDRWSDNKLIASSPFRDDNAPSFFVNLDGEYAGTWGDSGAYGTEYESGNFVKLLAYLRRETEYDTVNYLVDKYGVIGEIRKDEPIRVAKPKVSDAVRHITPLNVDITPATSPYLRSRGIGSDVQETYGIGYNTAYKGYTAIPWRDTAGAVANVKYRSTKGKRFFYEVGGRPIRDLVYGIHEARDSDYVVIAEGEIDVLSWASVGITAIATGSANVSDRQAQIIINSGYDRIYLAGDNDRQGREFNRRLADKLRGYAELYVVHYEDKKDANDVLTRRSAECLRGLIDKATQVRTINLRPG